MKKLRALLLFLICLTFLLPNSLYAQTEAVEVQRAESSNSDKLIVAYFNASQTYSSFEFANIDVVNYHPASVTANAMSYTGGSIVTHNYSSKLSYFRSEAVAQNPDIKFVLTVANGNLTDFESWLSSTSRAKTLADEMLNIIKTYGYDGLDIDYEFPSGGSNPRNNFVYFMSCVRQGLNTLSQTTGKDYILSMAVPGTVWAFELFNMNDLAYYVDYFNIMNYDLYVGEGTNAYTHHHTPPYDDTLFPGGSVYADIQLYLENGISADKIVPGCGLYARRWTGVNNHNNGLHQPGTLDDSNIHYSDIKARYVNKNGYVRYWDSNAQAPYLYNASSKVFLTYDDEQSVKIKCDIVGQQNVRGIMVFDYCTADGLGLYDSMRTWLDEASAPSHTHSYSASITKQPSCVTPGIITYTCECGDSYEEEYPAIGSHYWLDWVIIAEPTTTEEGFQQRSCRRCGAIESEFIPMLEATEPIVPEITVENFKITVSGADSIKDMRYALGEYTTPSEIKAAEGNVAISNALVQQYTVDGNFIYEMPAGGYYTIWIRMADGTSYILPLDITVITPTVSTNGVTVTLNNLYDVKDFYIAKGEYQSYREIKDNGYIISISGEKIGTRHNYSCTVYEPGVHTVLIRYNDGTQALFHETLTVDEPTFTENGLQLTISNIPDVRVIRTAYGEYETPGQVKRAAGARNFSAKTILAGQDEFTIQYREQGMITVTVEYYNGYQAVYHYNVQKKTPTVTRTENSITFGNLNGLQVLRYAKGQYTTASQIKAAEGSKALKLSSAVDGYITVSELTAGMYTFCVQYNDESYNYYTIVVK